MLPLLDACHADPVRGDGLCSCLTAPAVGRLRRVAGDIRLDPGQRLFGPGDAAEALYGLRQGAMMLERRLGDGRRQVTNFLFPGDMLGFADGDRHAVAAVALERVSLCRIPLSAAADDCEVGRHLVRAAERALRDAWTMQTRLGRMSAAERVGALLADLWERQGQPSGLRLPMRVVDLADHLGLRAETVSRELTRLRASGHVGTWSPDGVLPVLAPLDTAQPRRNRA